MTNQQQEQIITLKLNIQQILEQISTLISNNKNRTDFETTIKKLEDA